MVAIKNTHVVSDHRALLSGMPIPETSRERPWRQRDRDQYLEMLSRRQSERTGLPLARARDYGIPPMSGPLLRLDVGRYNHLAPLCGLVEDEFTEIVGRARKHRAA